MAEIDKSTVINLDVSPYVIGGSSTGGFAINPTTTGVSVASGVVNNSAEIPANNSISIGAGDTYISVKVVFDIKTDGTVVINNAATISGGFSTSKNPNTDAHIDISPGNTCTVYCFIGKVNLNGGVKTITQWLSGNFFVLPLGYQKQIWYA